MNAVPRHTLARIIAKHGREICETPKRLEGLLRDLCGAHRREINVLVGALEERVAADLLAAGLSMPHNVLLARLAKRLQDHLAYTPEAAHWAVDSWAVAVGVLSEAEFAKRALIDHAGGAQGSALRSTQTTPPGETFAAPPKPSSKFPSSNSSPLPPVTPQPNRPPRPLANAPRPMPAAQKPPAPIVSAPQPTRTKRSSTANAASVPVGSQQPFPLQKSSRRGLTLRGCLLGLLLITALIIGAVFAVPAIVSVLREEQAQPSINDPRTD